jgi:hypothetical protein
MNRTSAALLSIAAVAASVGANAVEITVAGSGTTSMDNNVNRLPFEMASVTGPGGSKSISGTGHQQFTNTAFGVISEAGGSGSAFADAGLLRAKVDGVALIGPGAPNVPTVTHGTPRVNASFGASFSDTVEIKSATLPIGAPATFRATVHLDVETNRPGHIGPAFAGFDSGTFFFNYFVGSTVGGTYSFPNGLFTSVPTFGFDLPVDVAGKVGDMVSVGAALGVTADNRAGFFTDTSGGVANWGGLSETHIDASHTARIFLDPITPGIALRAQSGHDYSISAVPEPASWLMLLAGMATVGAALRRRTVRDASKA